MTSRSKTSNVGAALDKLLSERGSNLSKLSATTNTSASYLSQLVSGHRRANGPWLELVSNVLELTDDEKKELVLAWAKDHGLTIKL